MTTLHSSWLVVFRCGCVGTRPSTVHFNDHMSVIFEECDGEQHTVPFYRHMTHAPNDTPTEYGPLLIEEEQRIITRIAEDVGRGVRFAEVQQLLGIPRKEN